MTKKALELTIADAYRYTGIREFLIDQKNRLTVPADYRVPGTQEKFLLIPNDKKRVVVAFSGADKISPKVLSASKFLASQAELVTMDGNGRITLRDDFATAAFGTIPKNRKFTIVGRGEFFEIWPADEWEKVKVKFHSCAAQALRDLQEIEAFCPDI